MNKYLSTTVVLILKLCVSIALSLWNPDTYPKPPVDTKPGFALRSRPTPKTPEQIAATKANAAQKKIDHAAQVQRNLQMIAARKRAAYLRSRRMNNPVYKDGNCMHRPAMGY